MSATHPIIAVTGSSGAGTTSVMRTFEQIFRREARAAPPSSKATASIATTAPAMKQKMAEALAQRRSPSSAISARTRTCSTSSRACSGPTARAARGRRRKYLHDEQEAAPYGSKPGTFTEWEDLPEGTDLLFYEGLHGAVASGEVDVAKHVDLLIGVVPVVNLEWIQKLHRDRSHARLFGRGGDGHDPAAHARLRELHLSAVLAHAHQLPARAGRRHVEPVHRALHTGAGRIVPRDPLRQRAGHRLSVPAVDAARLVHVALQHDRVSRRQDGPRDAAHLHADDPAADRAQEGIAGAPARGQSASIASTPNATVRDNACRDSSTASRPSRSTWTARSIDTAPDLAAAANMMLVILGGRPLPERCIPALIGDGVDQLRERKCSTRAGSSVAPDPALLTTAAALFRQPVRPAPVRAQSCLSRRDRDAACTRACRGIPSCCITNKDEQVRSAAARGRGAARDAGRAHAVRRPARRTASRARTCCSPPVRDLGVEPAQCSMSVTHAADIVAARAAGCRVVAVDYGYHHDRSLAGGAAGRDRRQPDRDHHGRVRPQCRASRH